MPNYVELSHHGEIDPADILRAAQGAEKKSVPVYRVTALEELPQKLAEAKTAGGGILLGDLPDGEVHVVVGHASQIDEDVCRELGAHVFRMEHLYGPLVLFHGDLSMFVVSRKPFSINKTGLRAGLTLLKAKGADAGFDGNDLMADGKKVGSGGLAAHGLDGWYVTGIHFSVNTDKGMVERICKKPMQKKPGALRDYGITADDVWRWMENEGVLSECLTS